MDNLRSELIDYHKWIVSLALFVLTISLSLSSLVESVSGQKGWLVAGWVLLGICVFANWLLIKSLLSAAVCKTVPEGDLTKLHLTQMGGALKQQQAYGLVQNASFLVGVLLVAVGYIRALW